MSEGGREGERVTAGSEVAGWVGPKGSLVPSRLFAPPLRPLLYASCLSSILLHANVSTGWKEAACACNHYSPTTCTYVDSLSFDSYLLAIQWWNTDDLKCEPGSSVVLDNQKY